MLPLDEITADVLILGAGGAGMLAALHVTTANPRARIVIAVKGLLGQSGCTRMVQGGYNCVLNPADSFEKHFDDTIRGGQFLNDQELAWTLVHDSPDRIIELENRIGCLFDRNPDGTIHQKPFAGQSFDRTVHKGDLTGIEIMSNLRDWVFEQPNVTVLEETRGLDFLTAGSRVAGAVLLGNRRGRFIAVTAKATLTATGAGATMYQISSPSLEKAADGQAMAARLGAEFVDMEMMQFHPTGILAGKSIATGGLLEEGLRGAGARLYNALGERYMERYAPDKLERATRDVVSRAGYMEIMAGRGTPAGGVMLDASHIPDVARHFAGMVERCREYGFDLVNSRVEVSPSAHYHMGGIRIDVHCRTTVDGLFAAGEDTGGVHGANRLGGNGVADSIVFGARAGDTMADYISTIAYGAVASATLPSRTQVTDLCARWLAPLERSDGENPFQLRQRLEHTMWTKVGVVRSGADMEQALSEIQQIRQRINNASTTPAPYKGQGEGVLNSPSPRWEGIKGGVEAHPTSSAIYNAMWNESINTENLALIAEMLTRGALARRESRGAHYRSDFPNQTSDWLKNIVIRPRPDGDFEITYQPVQFTRLTPQELKQHRERAGLKTLPALDDE
jgi:succinate dehydrogenase / fumarate reductase flavoprotein subunit/fumarate reductase flavoprotein subunit